MEQKKTLWIIAAVSVFLLVVMGAAMILYNPLNGSSRKTASINPVEKTAQVQNNQSGWTNSTSPVQTTSSPQVNDMFVVSENTTVLGFNQPAQTDTADQSTTIDLNALKRELASEAALNPNPSQNINITVNLSDKENQAKVEEPPVILTTEYYTGKAKEAEAAEKAAAVKNTDTAVASSTPASTSTKVAKAETKTTAKSNTTTSTKASAAATTSTKTNPVTRFWVQVAAYSNKKGAEEARSVLDENKIPSDIFTYRDNKDKLYYRVRVGPYTTKSEAEYWRSKIVKIKEIDNANDSYITSTVN